MDSEKIIQGVVGGVVAGFSIGVGFLIAQRMMSKWAYGGNASAKKEDDVAEAVKKGVAEGVKQVNMDQAVANFSSAMSAAESPKHQKASRRPAARFSGFDGNPQKMNFNGDPRKFGASPNGALNNF